MTALKEDDMNASRFSRRLRLCLPAAALALLIFAGASYGQASTGKFSVISPINGIEGDFVCQPAATGVVTGTETVVGEYTQTPQGTHFHGTATQDYRIVFADGRYLVSSSPSHFDFNQTGQGPAVYTEVQQDRGTLYTAAGERIGIVSVSTLTHTTWSDTNGNQQPDPGEITIAAVDKFRVSCP